MTTRRGFLGGMLSGLGALCLGKDEPPIIETDHIFDTVKGVPCIPVDQWFNRMKKYTIERANFAWVWRDQVPVYYPETVVEAAIQQLPQKYGSVGYEIKSTYAPLLTEKEELERRRKTVPKFFITNPRITDYRDGRWLIVDILCVKEDVPEEFKHLTALNTETFVSYLSRREDDEMIPWPEYWGVSGMASDLWPVGKGLGELSKDGLKIKEMKITDFILVAGGPYGNPMCVSWIWHGKTMFDNREIVLKMNQANYYTSDEWNPLRQYPRETLEELSKGPWGEPLLKLLEKL